MKNVVSMLKEEEQVPTPRAGELAWSESLIQHIGLNNEKWNPDHLIGRKGHGIYKLMMTDEQVKAVVRFKRDAITSRDWFLEYGIDSNLSKAEQERRIAFFKTVFDRVEGSFGDALNGIMSAIYNGFSMTEKVFEQFVFENSVFWGLRALKLRPFDTFIFRVDQHGNIETVVQRMQGREQALDMEKFIHFKVNPDVDEHYGGSELREAHKSWHYKEHIEQFWAIWTERHATGYFWVQPSVEGEVLQQGSEEWLLIKQIIETKTAASSFAFPRKLDVQMQFPANQVAFKEAVNHHDLGIAKAMLVPNLLGVSTQSSTGSFAQASTQLEAFLWTLDHDASRLSDCVDNDIICHIGDINFGDGEYPKFVFKSISDSKKLELVEKWKELVGSDAVITTNSDQQHLRELLGFPQVDEEKLARIDKEIIPHMLDVIKQYASASIPIETATALLVAMLPLDEIEVTALIAEIQPKEPVVPAGLDEDEDEDDPEAGAIADDLLEDEDLQRKKGDELYEQTPKARGRTQITNNAEFLMKKIMKAAFQMAERRVDFQKIEQDTDRIQEEEVINISKLFANEVKKIVPLIEEIVSDENSSAKQINNLKFNSVKIRNAVQGFLRRAWDLGKKTGEDELQRTSLKNIKIDFGRLEDRAADFFEARSFQVAGKFSSDALSEIKNQLFNGIKGSKTPNEIIDGIYEKFAREGNMTVEDAEEALGRSFNVENPSARLRTMIRTNTFESFNEARHDLYTDPDLDGFVVALEYSSVLDTRTTDICRHLDGRAYATDNELWETYRPPNHFNCRGVTIPLLSTDDFELTPDSPSIEPQEGFS